MQDFEFNGFFQFFGRAESGYLFEKERDLH